MAERDTSTADWFDSQGDPTGQAPVSTTMPVPNPNAPAPGGGAPDYGGAFQTLQGLVGPGSSRQEMEAAIAKAFGQVPGYEQAYKESVKINGQWYDLVQGYGAEGAKWQTPAWGSGGGAGGAGGGGSAGMQAALETSPGFQFRLAEGQKALERSAAAKGTLLTGGTAKALTRYGQDFASNEYNNRYNQLYGLSQLGLNAAGQSGSLGSSYAGQAGNLLSNQAGAGTNLITSGANAGAAGTVGGANAWQNAFGNLANQAQQSYWMWLMSQGQRPPATA
jgi:hypothetical protein